MLSLRSKHLRRQIALVSSLAGAVLASAPSGFDWRAVQPSWDLRYIPCYGEFECARVLMPLDWLAPHSTNETVAIAVLKVPATVPITDESFGGTVMVNPGGPGDSGVVHMLKNGRYIQTMVDANKHYEVLSFDIRGVAFSTPPASCYRNSGERLASTWQSRGLGAPSTDDAHLARQLAQYKSLGHKCAQHRDENLDFNIHEFTSTASIANDMLRLVDETEILQQKLLSRTIGFVEHLDDDTVQHPLRHRDQQTTNARLQYYGTSYGTVLGNTFLSMFPGRVKRMIIDGVVVADDWVSGVRRRSAHVALTK